MKAKIGEKLKKHSVAAKIIPAVAMLATSAVMLSTATYAWFTLGKEVKVTGLNMTATASEGIEISLASVTGETNSLTFVDTMGNTYDSDTEKGWKSSVVVGDYYSDIGKLKPASSCDGTSLFYATDASNGGKSATTFKAIVLRSGENLSDMAGITTKNTLDTSGAALTSTGTTGYYVDIPVHIRTSKFDPDTSDTNTQGNIYCKMTIDDNVADGDKELFKAVRVAFIKDDDDASIILGADKNYYESENESGKAVNGDSSRGTVTVTTDSVFSGEDTGTEYAGSAVYNNSPGTDSGLMIDYASTNESGNLTYGHLDFTVRIWLEGESTFCFDQNAGQSWNIGLAFSLGAFETSGGGTGGSGD